VRRLPSSFLQIELQVRYVLRPLLFFSLRLVFIFATCYLHNIVEGGNWMKLVTVLLPEAYLEGLDELVRANMYPSRSSVIRSAVRDLLKKELWEKRGR
jgi:hypothetical protein